MIRWSYVFGTFFFSLFVALLSGAFYKYGYEQGQTNGVDMYHSYCYNNGGYIINEKSPHTIVDCSSLGVLPDEEYNKLMENNTHIPKVQPTQEKKDSWKESA